MDYILLLLGLFFALLGIVGSFLPIIPGPVTSWLGLLFLYLTRWVPFDSVFLTLTFLVAVGVFLLDYIIPLLGTKQFGGSKNGMIGSTLGLLIGLIFLGPLGVLVGPFLGAFIGELTRDSKNIRTAGKAALGSLIGFLTGVFLKFSVALVYVFFFFRKAYTHLL
ncbi:MAG: DUF456 domain-containing protein [Flavobacteriaceae bacterium]